MIILITGVPCSGKTTLLQNLCSRLPNPKEDVFEPIPLWKCKEYGFANFAGLDTPYKGDILHVQHYPIFSHHPSEDAYIPMYQKFCNEVTVKYRHTIIECDVHWGSEEIQWVLDNHESQVFLLTVDSNEELRRLSERTEGEVEIDFHSHINTIQSNINVLNVRENNSIEDSLKIEDEIYVKVI